MKALIFSTILVGGIAIADTPVTLGSSPDFATADGTVTVEVVLISLCATTGGDGNPVSAQADYAGPVTWTYAGQTGTGRSQYGTGALPPVPQSSSVHADTRLGGGLSEHWPPRGMQ